MKVCKNDSDIILYPVTKCSLCVLRARLSPCLWLKVVGTRKTLNCGGIKTDVLSDIFTL